MLALLPLVAVAATGCGGDSRGGSGGTASSASPSGDQPVFRLGTVGSGYDSLNPFVGMYAQDYAAWMLMYPNLAQYTNDSQPQPDFAESWTTSAGRPDWTFKTRVRRDVDGRPAVTAKTPPSPSTPS